LENGLVLCRVNSWITGRRLISLPFSDHCEPLVANAAGARSLANALEAALRTGNLRYVEVRAKLPLQGPTEACLSTQTYCFHELDLRPGLDTLFANFHKSSTQRKIQRAEREGLTCECGRSPALLDAFWDLLLITRRRHGIPPQPKVWFQNLIACFGDALQIRVAFQARQPAAAILTIRQKDSLVYKYGCSDTSLNHLGGTQLLFWRAIQEASPQGLRVLDLGRSDCGNEGLITFKDRLGATRSTLTYSRFSPSLDSGAFGTAGAGWAGRLAGRLAPRLPDRVLRLAGRVLYRHIA
jgi:CelD/BcsL family acetyltransferase involved in cellulose biosynthesis